MRAGYAFRCVSQLHNASPERFWIRETRSAIVWGMVLPIAILLIGAFTHGIGLLLLAVFPIQVFRIYRDARSRMPHRSAWLYACYCVPGKIAEAIGILTFYLNSLRGQSGKLIEYKGASGAECAGGRKVASA
jgi:hypothetical protein